MKARRASQLSPNCQLLMRLMQEVGFGIIEGLVVRDGEPVMQPPPRIVHQIKFAGDAGPRPERNLSDFELKRAMIRFFDEIQRIQDGVIDRVEIKHGLPFCMFMTNSAA